MLKEALVILSKVPWAYSLLLQESKPVLIRVH